MLAVIPRDKVRNIPGEGEVAHDDVITVLLDTSGSRLGAAARPGSSRAASDHREDPRTLLDCFLSSEHLPVRAVATVRAMR